MDSPTSAARAPARTLLLPSAVDRRSTTSRPGSLEETKRVRVIDYAPTRIYRQAHRTRTPARPMAVVLESAADGGLLPHPRLVRRARPTPPPKMASRAPSRAPSHIGFDDEPTPRRR